MAEPITYCWSGQDPFSVEFKIEHIHAKCPAEITQLNKWNDIFV